ncbi:MAG: ABC transporter ATP-binding protein [candidate division KSB1 bacterium]|nr:ABC transporter ATP-binding protein [candidate division KSB1 bacterium]
MEDALLRVEGLVASYGKKEILKGLSLEVHQGEVVCLIGPNGAGKSTLLKAIMGIVRPLSGKVIFDGQDITALSPYKRSRMGIGYLRQGGSIFPNLSVEGNLRLVHQSPGHTNGVYENQVQDFFAMFPELSPVRGQRAGSLSGGQQQMLSLAMATLKQPRLLLLDEPSAGLAPALVNRLMDNIRELHTSLGIAVLLVEQNVRRALAISRRAYLMKQGLIARTVEEPSRLTEEESFQAVLQV